MTPPRLYPRGTRPEDIPTDAVGIPWAEYQRRLTLEDLVDPVLARERSKRLAEEKQRADEKTARASGNTRMPGTKTRRLIPDAPEQTPDVGAGYTFASSYLQRERR
jgi:hypothetical protein